MEEKKGRTMGMEDEKEERAIQGREGNWNEEENWRNEEN